MPETMSADRERSALFECRGRVADTHARAALLDEIVARVEPPAQHAGAVNSARVHLEAALTYLDDAPPDRRSGNLWDHYLTRWLLWLTVRLWNNPG